MLSSIQRPPAGPDAHLVPGEGTASRFRPEAGAPAGRPAGRRGLLAAALAAGLVLIAVLAAIHLTQGSAPVSVAQLWHVITGGGEEQATAVLLASRVPRLLAGLLVGVALGTAGVVMQTVARNILASPDTLAVNAGAYLAVVAFAAFGISVPLLTGSLIAFLGGLAAAALVLGLAAGGGGGNGGGTVRLVLAGSAIALAFSALTTMLLLLFAEETTGLFAWGAGTLGQTSIDGVAQLGPVVLAAFLALLLLAHKLDILALGDDTASVLGIRVRRTQTTAIVLAVLLSASAVTVAGPIGFVGLAAPAIVRLLAARIPGLQRHRALIPAGAIMGVIVVLGADVLLRLVFGGSAAVAVPTGVVTTVFGAVFLVILARRLTDGGGTGSAGTFALGTSSRPLTRRLLIVGAGVLLVAVAFASLLLGDAKLLAGDLLNWATGQAGPVTEFVLNTRMPRVLAAILAGAALAVAGAVVQAVSRNPLAEPALLGVTGGAGVGAVLVITIAPLASFWAVSAGGLLGAVAAAVIVFGLAAAGGFAQSRLILIGIGVSAAAGAIVSMLIIATDPYNAAKALTWMSGSTYGRTLPQLLPVLVALVLAAPILAGARRDLDVLAQDDDTPRILGVPLGRTRLWLLSVAVALSAAAVAAVGVIGFVGLVAPHAARALVGGRHALVLPMSALLGALLVCVADTLGRTVIAPGQLPAGLLTAVVGAPYFVWLLWRSRRTS
ncbi:iron ABC transporter permease [Microterricola viridarii]|uniref:Iron complex transport system permease protein n=1 Tax=Microterricola viridarii TaxID=412690 RepID=A0A1H1RBH6_9MICO|nr:iron ABC transporter permease [Microterricola viridarii]SDS33033.1 iron complex transport system permease protein [Microterricola viridarii]